MLDDGGGFGEAVGFADCVGETAGGGAEVGFCEDLGDGVAEGFRGGVWGGDVEAGAGPGDAGGDAGLVMRDGDGDHGHAGGEAFEGGVHASVGDHEGGAMEHFQLRGEGDGEDVGRERGGEIEVRCAALGEDELDIEAVDGGEEHAVEFEVGVLGGAEAGVDEGFGGEFVPGEIGGWGGGVEGEWACEVEAGREMAAREFEGGGLLGDLRERGPEGVEVEGAEAGLEAEAADAVAERLAGAEHGGVEFVVALEGGFVLRMGLAAEAGDAGLGLAHEGDDDCDEGGLEGGGERGSGVVELIDEPEVEVGLCDYGRGFGEEGFGLE